MSPKVRKATAADAGTLVSLVNSVYRGEGASASWTTEAHLLEGIRVDENAILEVINRPQSLLLVAVDDDGAIMGCVQLELQERGCYFGMLSVRATHQKSGLGSFLIDAAEKYGREEFKSKHIFGYVISIRSELLAYYVRRGYKTTGEKLPFSGTATSRSKVGDLFFEVILKAL